MGSIPKKSAKSHSEESSERSSNQKKNANYSRERLARIIFERLGKEYPGSASSLCALQHKNPFQLLVATILSAQCTDERVNQVTPLLFAEYPTPALLAKADPSRLEEIVRPTGFYRSKSGNLIAMAEAVTTNFKGKIPKQMDDLVSLPGVGRKTANVILSVAYNLPGLPVDTHVQRLTKRMGLTTETTPDKIEMDISPLLKPEELGAFSLRLILHGRKVCKARKPLCDICPLADICPSSGITVETAAEIKVGAKSSK